MKAHLAFGYEGINHQYHSGLWRTAVRSIGWEEAPLEQADLTVMWGPNPEYDATLARNKPVLMCDFPYWNRGDKNRNGHEYYKVSLNGQHPTPYIMKEKHNDDRYRQTKGPAISPWRSTPGEYILLAGMGLKAAKQFGHELGGWEEKIVGVIRQQTDMPIIYRPKPRQSPVRVIPGTIPDDGALPIDQVLPKAHAVVCHHGNPTVAALAAGIPIFMNGPIGAASHLASFDFDKINEPKYPDNRAEFLHNLAHWQWSVEEIKSGQVFRSYLERGLLL